MFREHDIRRLAIGFVLVVCALLAAATGAL